MQPHPSSSSLSFKALGFDPQNPLVFDTTEASTSPGQHPVKDPMDTAPTLADLGRMGYPYFTNKELPTQRDSKPFRPYFQAPRMTYHELLQKDEALEEIIKQGMDNFITIYDKYYPLMTKGLADEDLISLIETTMLAQEANITAAIDKLSCPVKQFQAKYRLAVLTEDEDAYPSLIQNFFNHLFEQQNTSQRLDLLKFLAKPSPRPLSMDFELFRLDTFLKILNNPELPFDYEEKSTLLDAYLDFTASCLASRLSFAGVSCLWNKWLALSNIYKDLDQSFERRNPLPLGTLYQKLSLALATYYHKLSRDNPYFPLCAMYLGALSNDMDLVQELLEMLKKSKKWESHTFQLDPLLVLLHMYADEDNPQFNIGIVSIIVKLIVQVIDRPDNYESRWKELEKLCLSLLDIGTSRRDPECLQIVKCMLQDNEADLNYKKSVYTYLRLNRMNQADSVERFNNQELRVRKSLNSKIRLLKQHLAISRMTGDLKNQ
jgi:hypothetical protein